MSTRQIAKALAMLCFTLTALPAFSGWMLDAGRSKVVIGLNLGLGSSFWDGDGQRRSGGCSNNSLPVGYEYGYSYYRTIYANTSLGSKNCSDKKSVGLSNIELGVRGRLDPYRNGSTWEIALLLPINKNHSAFDSQTGSFGLKAGIGYNFSDDPYETFLLGGDTSRWAVAMGIKTWQAHIPNELWGNLNYDKRLSSSDWYKQSGGWSFNAQLDGKHSFGKVNSAIANPFVVDAHDSYSLLTGTAKLTHALSDVSYINGGIALDLAGRNIHSGSSLFIGYNYQWSYK